MTLFFVCYSVCCITGFTPSVFQLSSFPFFLRRYEVNLGLEVRGLTVTVFNGAYFSNNEDILELKWSISNSISNLSNLEKALDIF